MVETQVKELSFDRSQNNPLSQNHKNPVTDTDTVAHRSLVAPNKQPGARAVSSEAANVSLPRQVVVCRNAGRKNSGPKNGESNARVCLGRTSESSAG